MVDVIVQRWGLVVAEHLSPPLRCPRHRVPATVVGVVGCSRGTCTTCGFTSVPPPWLPITTAAPMPSSTSGTATSATFLPVDMPSGSGGGGGGAGVAGRGAGGRARLGDEIDRARRLYEERVGTSVPDRDAYFHQELVQTLADGDASLFD